LAAHELSIKTNRLKVCSSNQINLFKWLPGSQFVAVTKLVYDLIKISELEKAPGSQAYFWSIKLKVYKQIFYGR
jgi:hypothetical protein